MKRFGLISPALIIPILILGSCASYKSNIMFEASSSSMGSDWLEIKPFTIEPGDHLLIEIMPWDGEEMIITMSGDNNTAGHQLVTIVDQSGQINLPLIGKHKLQGLMTSEADSLLKNEYSEFLKEPFIKTTFQNKHVSIIGSFNTQIVSLEDENLRISDIIAQSGGLTNQSRANKIRLLRGSEYFIADLSKASNRQQNDIPIRPGDLIYIEPVRRPFGETLKEATPAISILSTILTITTLLLTLL